jgi:glycosyltransferase involved in cell wall biosynthesis
MRLVILQYGNYAEAEHLFASGGRETYYGQRYSVGFVAELAARIDTLTVLHLSRNDAEEELPSGVRSLGLDLYPRGRRARHLELLRTLERLRPDHLILGAPLPLVVAWALMRGVRILPLFADSFLAQGIKARFKFAALARLLNNKRVDWVSNHNLAASLDLVRIGVAADKVLPFDWPHPVSPADRSPKELPTEGEFRLIYVGQVTEEKGVGDLIEAVRLLNAGPAGRRWTATIVGGHDGALARKAEALGLSSAITFAGAVSHDDVVPLMNQHDAVVVPSRHEYPEGLPMTIYEGLCSRTPIVSSDHPMFKMKLRHGESAMVFPAANPAALAQTVRELGTNPEIYSRLSKGADIAAAAFGCPLKYHELISRWLSGSPEDRRVLSSFSVASGRYGDREPNPRTVP